MAGYACVEAALCESGKCVNDSCEGGAGYLTAGQYCSDQPHNTLLTQAEANTQCVSGICDLTSNTCLGSAVPFWPSMVCVPAIHIAFPATAKGTCANLRSVLNCSVSIPQKNALKHRSQTLPVALPAPVILSQAGGFAPTFKPTLLHSSLVASTLRVLRSPTRPSPAPTTRLSASSRLRRGSTVGLAIVDPMPKGSRTQ